MRRFDVGQPPLPPLDAGGYGGSVNGGGGWSQHSALPSRVAGPPWHNPHLPGSSPFAAAQRQPLHPLAAAQWQPALPFTAAQQQQQQQQPPHRAQLQFHELGMREGRHELSVSPHAPHHAWLPPLPSS